MFKTRLKVRRQKVLLPRRVRSFFAVVLSLAFVLNAPQFATAASSAQITAHFDDNDRTVKVAGAQFLPRCDIRLLFHFGQQGVEASVAADDHGSFAISQAVPSGFSGLVKINAYAKPSRISIYPETFGARGDGINDDTKALQAAFDALSNANRLVLAKGKTYRHSDVISINRDSAWVTGGGTLMATNEARSSVWINANNVTVDGGLILRIDKTTKRWDAPEQHKLVVKDHSSTRISNVSIDGSAAAGLFVMNANNFAITDVKIENTRADGLHMTDRSHDGVVSRVTASNVGDDGVAVVSYQNDKDVVRNIVVDAPTVLSQTWGRGITVVGGDHITYRNAVVTNSCGAAIYVGNEGNPYFTYPATNVEVLGATVTNSNVCAPSPTMGAVLVYSGNSAVTNSHVHLDSVIIDHTSAQAHRQVGLLGSATDVTFSHFKISASPDSGPPVTFDSDQPRGAEQITDWLLNGSAYQP